MKEETKVEGGENLLTAFKKARKESANNEKEKKSADENKDKKSVDESKDKKLENERRSRSRSTSKTRRHSRSRSRSKLKAKKRRSRSISKAKDKYKRRSRSRDKYKKRSRSHSRSRRSISRNRYRGGKRSRSRSGSRSRQYNKNRKTKRSPSKEKRKSPDCGDSLRDKANRKRLLEVARKNAVYLMKNNCLPPSIEKESVIATGKSVEELTSFCRQLVSKEYSDGEPSEPSLSPDEHESVGPSRHHPFAVKDSKPIMMNIRNAPMLPVKTNAERLADTSKLREQFPVSSGTQHRTVESEWVPVEKGDKEKPTVTVFPEASRLSNIDITTLVSSRLTALKRLQDNPTDRDAMKAFSSAQKDMQDWALSKQVPGQFTGSTGVKILSAEELKSGYQAWAKKDQFRTTKKVTSHFGMKMLQKMGWSPGEGLGKNREGQLEPLVLDLKLDRKGLSAQTEVLSKRAIPLMKSLSGKHPVTALIEICLKRKWDPPVFEVVFDHGPVHNKNFLMKVRVNNQTYKAAGGASNKKIAKANAAAACMQALGLIPQAPAAPIKSQETLHTTVNAPPTALGPDPPTSEQPQMEGQGVILMQDFQQDQQQVVPQYADNGTQDPMAQYGVDNAQASQYGNDATQAGMVQYDAEGNPVPQYDTDGNQVITQYDTDGNPITMQYDADGNQVMAPYAAADGTQEMPQYGTEDSQAMHPYSTEDPNNLQHYSADGSHAMPQYGADSAHTQYAPDGTGTSQYGTDGTHSFQYGTDGTAGQYSADATQYSTNNTEAVAQYGTNTDTMQYSSNDAHGQYSDNSASHYQTDNTQGSASQYTNNMQSYPQYSAENVQSYHQPQQQQQQHQDQHQQYDANSRSGSFSFPQPPRSLIHGIGDDEARGSSGSSGDAAANHRGRDTRNTSYGNSNSYSNNSSYNNQMQYYGGSYQGSQY